MKNKTFTKKELEKIKESGNYCFKREINKIPINSRELQIIKLVEEKFEETIQRIKEGLCYEAAEIACEECIICRAINKETGDLR